MADCIIPVLTDEHRASFDASVEKWTAIGRSTESCDQMGARESIAAAYAAANLAPPRIFWAVSPIGGVIMRHIVRAGVADGVWAGVEAGVGDGVRAGVRDGVRAGVRAGVEDGVRAGVRAGVEDGVPGGVRAGVADGVWAGVEAGVWDGVWAGVEAGVRAGVRDGIEDGVRAGWYENVLYGCHESWLSYYDWFGHHGMSETVHPLQGLIGLAKSAGWAWVHKGFVVISDRPATLHDERVAGTRWRRRLHNADGPSVSYRDGWQLHHWHGQLVPEWVITDPSVANINEERNTEVRRCAIENHGWDRYLDAMDVRPVSVEPDPGNPGHDLELFDLPDEMQIFGDRVRLLVMENASRDRDGTRRKFAETVPADILSAVAAAAWQFDVSEGDYRLLERAT